MPTLEETNSLYALIAIEIPFQHGCVHQIGAPPFNKEMTNQSDLQSVEAEDRLKCRARPVLPASSSSQTGPKPSIQPITKTVRILQEAKTENPLNPQSTY